MKRVEIGSWRRHAQILSLPQCCRWARWRQAHMESPKDHIELVTEIIPPGRSRCFAKCEMQNVSGVYRAEPDILFNFRRPQICLFCMRISDVIRPSVCKTRYLGELATSNVCGKEGSFRNMPQHVETNHITGYLHSCDICSKTFRSKHASRLHKVRSHQKPIEMITGLGAEWVITSQGTIEE